MTKSEKTTKQFEAEIARVSRQLENQKQVNENLEAKCKRTKSKKKKLVELLIKKERQEREKES